MTEEQIIEQLFEGVKQELDRQMLRYKSEIDEQLQAHVPMGSKQEFNEFLENQKKYYANYFSDAFGKPSAMKFSRERYENFIRDLYQPDELEEYSDNTSRRRELILHHAHLFMYSEIISYLQSLKSNEDSASHFHQGHHKITIYYEQLDRRKNNRPTELDRRESVAFYELLSDIGWFLNLKNRTKTNVATCVGLSSGFSIRELEKEIDKVTKQDKIEIAKKLIKRLQDYLPPE